MGNPQTIKFSHVSNFLESLPAQEAAIVERLRELIVDTLPDCREKLAYNVPFYYRRQRLVYSWPASVPWGGVKQGVVLGFCQGVHELEADSGSYRLVKRKLFLTIGDIDSAQIRQLLHEAVLADATRGQGV